LSYRLTSGKAWRIPEPARVGEHTFDVLTHCRGSGAAVVELRELELGRQDGAEARVGDARRPPLHLGGACGNAEEGARAAATAMPRSKGMGRRERESPTGLAPYRGADQGQWWRKCARCEEDRRARGAG
jgi:hypothetical protein